MTDTTFADATRQAMHEEMARDPAVFLMGEDIFKQGGIFGQFKGLADSFGVDRVRDTPISESVLVSTALGAALTGSRPVVDLHFADFIACAMDEVVSQIAKVRYMFGGQAHAPLVLRMPDGAVKSAAAQHSSSPEAWFAHVPGLRVVAPAFPADAKSLLKAAIRCQDPVLYLEHKALYTRRGPVGDADTVGELGRAAVVRPGKDVTVASWSLTLHKVLQAAEELATEGVCDVEVIDMRSLAPLDVQTVVTSVRRTGRLLIAHEAVTTCGVGAELAALVQEQAFGQLAAPIRRIGNVGVPVPFAPVLERAALPQPDTIRAAIRDLL